MVCIKMMSFKNFWEFIISTFLTLLKFLSLNDVRRPLFLNMIFPSIFNGTFARTKDRFFAWLSFKFFSTIFAKNNSLPYHSNTHTFFGTSMLFRRSWNCFEFIVTNFANFFVGSKYFSFSPTHFLSCFISYHKKHFNLCKEKCQCH